MLAVDDRHAFRTATGRKVNILHFTPDDVDIDWLLRSRHLHVTGVFPALSPTTLAATRKAIATMREAGRTLSFDPNLRPTLWRSPEEMRATLNALAAECDWVLPGVEEGCFLTGHSQPERIAAHYRERGAKLVIVKLGPEGAYYDGEAGTGYVAPFAVSQVVDTVGAGDTFQCALLTWLAEHDALSAEALRTLPKASLASALDFAGRAAAITCSRRGADLPRRSELA